MFAERLRELRRRDGMTQDDLAKRLGVVKSTVSQWESGYRVPSEDILRQLAQIFDVSVDYLIGYSNTPDPAERIIEAISDDEELTSFWMSARERPTLKIFLKQVSDLDDESIKRIIRVIKAIEDEEAE